MTDIDCVSNFSHFNICSIVLYIRMRMMHAHQQRRQRVRDAAGWARGEWLAAAPFHWTVSCGTQIYHRIRKVLHSESNQLFDTVRNSSKTYIMSITSDWVFTFCVSQFYACLCTFVLSTNVSHKLLLLLLLLVRTSVELFVGRSSITHAHNEWSRTAGYSMLSATRDIKLKSRSLDDCGCWQDGKL